MKSFSTKKSQITELSTNTTSFLSVIKTDLPKEDIFLTIEDLEKKNRSSHKTFAICFILFTFFNNLIYLMIVFLGKQSYLDEKGSCKIIFFSNFYLNLLINLVLIIYHFRELQIFQKTNQNKINQTFLFFHSKREIISLFIVECVSSFLLYMEEQNSCGSSLIFFINIFVLVEFFEYGVQLIMSFYYIYKIVQNYDMSVAFDEESENSSKMNQKEKFNGSFALNLSETAPSCKDVFKYRNRKETPKKDINLHDFDMLEVVKKNDQFSLKKLNKKLIKFNTPTKNLTDEFKSIHIGDKQENVNELNCEINKIEILRLFWQNFWINYKLIMEQKNILVNLIQHSIEEEDVEKRSELEIEILEITEDQNIALSLFLEIFGDDSISQKIKVYALVLFKKLNLTEINHELISEFVNECFVVLMSKTENLEKKNLFQSLIDYSSKSTIESGKVFLMIKNLLFIQISDYISKNSLDSSTGLGIIKILIPLYKNSESEDYILTIQKTYPVVERIESEVIEESINALESSEFNKCNIGSQNFDTVCEMHLELIDSYMKLLKRMTLRLNEMNNNYEIKEMEELCNDKNFIESVFGILMIKIGNLFVNNQNFFYNMTEYETLNEKLHKIKKKAFEVFNIIFSNYLEKEDEEKQKKEFLEQTFVSLCKLTLESLYIFYKNPNLNLINIQNQKALKQILKKTYIFLINASKNFEFFEIFSKIKEQIIINIILINFLPSPLDYEELVDNPSDFVANIENIIYLEELENLKVYNAELLFNICKYIDYTLTFTFFILNDLLNFGLNNESHPNELQQYKHLIPIQQLPIFSKTSNKQKIQLSLLVLSILKDHISERKDLLASLDQTLKLECQKFFAADEYTKTLFILFIAEFISDIPFPSAYNANEGEINTMKIELLEFVIESTNEEGAMSEASLTNMHIISNNRINKLNSQDYLKYLIEPYLEVLLTQISMEANVEGNIGFLSHLLNRNKVYFCENEILFSKIVESLMNRLGIEESKEDKGIHGEDNINCIWNVIRLICEIEDYAKRYFSVLDKNLSKIVSFIIENENKVKNWDEDLFECYENLIKFNLETPECIDELFSLFPKLVKIYKFRITIIFPILNLLLYHCADYFDQDKTKLVMLIIKGCIDNAEYSNENNCNLYFPDVLLLLQILIQSQSEHFTEELFAYCSKIHENMIQFISEDGNLITNFFWDKTDGILLSLFISNEEYAWSIYGESIQVHIDRIIANASEFQTKYEMKLLVEGLISILDLIIFKEIDKSKVEKILNFLIPFMKLIQNQEIVKSYLQIQKSRPLLPEEKVYMENEEELLEILNLNNIENLWINLQNDLYQDDESDESFLFEYKQSYHNLKINLVKKLLSKLNNVDEYLLLEELFEKLEKNNFQFKDLELIFSTPMMLDVSNEIRYIRIADNPLEKKIRRIVRYKRVVS